MDQKRTRHQLKALKISNKGDSLFHPKRMKYLIVVFIALVSSAVHAGIFGTKKPVIVEPVKETKVSAAAKKKEIKKAAVIAEEGSFSPFKDQKPQYPGGNSAMKQFIAENIKSIYSEEDIYGTVTCSFVVNLDGSISNFETVESLGLYFDAEAIRIIKLFPNWIPGKKNGVPVKAYQSVEIYFKRQKQPKENKRSIKSVIKPIYKNRFISKIASYIKKPSRRMELETAD
jgi:hypothetical protein